MFGYACAITAPGFFRRRTLCTRAGVPFANFRKSCTRNRFVRKIKKVENIWESFRFFDRYTVISCIGTDQIGWRKFQNSRRDMNFFSVIFIEDFEYELRIEKFMQMNRWAPFCPVLALLRGLIRSLSNSTKIWRTSFLTKITKKNWQYLWSFSWNCHFKFQKLPKFMKISEVP